jgi:hypothetical protein
METSSEVEPSRVEELVGHAEVLDISTLPDGEGPGFIRVIPASDDFAETVYHIADLARGGANQSLATTWPERRLYPVEEEIPAEPGQYLITFRAEGTPCPPPPIVVPVRPGLGAVIVVRYYRRSDLARWEREAERTLRFIKSLTCNGAPMSHSGAGPGTA